MNPRLCCAALCSTTALACGGKEHPPIIDVTEMGAAGMNGQASNGSGSTSAGSTGSGTSGGLSFVGSEMYIVVGLRVDQSQVAVVQLSQPSMYAAGLSPLLNEASLSISDGALYYLLNFDEGLFRFAPDLITNLPPAQAQLPDNPQTNDPLLATPPCDLDSDGSGPENIRAAPDGRLIYECQGDGWYEVDGGRIEGPGGVLALGNSNDALLADYSILDLESGDLVAPSMSLGRDVRAVRATAAGFRVALWNPESLATTLWSIARSGEVQLQGEYPPSSDFVDTSPNLAAALDGAGALYAPSGRQVLKLSVDGNGEIVFDADENQPALGDVQRVFSGP